MQKKSIFKKWWFYVGLFILIGIIGNLASKDENKAMTVLATSEPKETVAPTQAPTPTPTIDPAVQKAIDDKAKADAAAKVIADKTAKDKADVDAKKAADDKKKKLTAATINLRAKADEVTDLTWYQAKTSPVYINQNGMFLRFSKDKDASVSNLVMAIQYAGDDWVFIDKYTIKVDDQSFEIVPDYDEAKRDNGSGGVWETYSAYVTKETLEILNAISTSKKTIIRHEGDQHYYDRVVTEQEKKAIKDVLDAYQAMGGSDELLKLKG